MYELFYNDYFILGLCLGLLFCFTLFTPYRKYPRIQYSKLLLKNPEVKIKNSSIFICKKHIHHWLIFLLILLLSYKSKQKFNTIKGFSYIMILQGLSYRDRFCFVENGD